MAEASEKGGSTAASGNPYLNAKEEWLERYGNYISRAAQWRMADQNNPFEIAKDGKLINVQITACRCR